MNTNTLVLHNVTPTGIICNVLCLEGDYNQLIEEKTIDMNHEVMDENIFRLLYPNAYSYYLQKELPYCIGLWIEQLNNGDKDYTKDENMVFTDSYMIAVLKDRIIVTLYINCPALEAALLILYIKDHIKDLMELQVKNSVDFYCFTDN